MKIGEQVKELTIVGDIGETKRATISADKMAKLQYLLTKGLYRDPVTAVIAEWTNNGIDSVVQGGKNPIENPVMVTIGVNPRGQTVFSVEDKGTGLDDKEFENICMNYLESTKENDDSAIGHFGIGMKSFLSLERSATFTCRKDGVERVYLVYEGEEFVNYDLLTEKETKEENGVKAELVIRDYFEKQQFIQKATQKLAYYDTAVLVIDNNVHTWTITRNDLFQMSTANNNHVMHLCLKDVYYSIDWEALGIKPLGYGIALRFNLTDGIVPTPSRESYITNDKTKKLIMNRIIQVAEWMVKKYNETVKEFATFKEAYPYIGTSVPTYHLPMPDGTTKSFVLSPLSDYSTINILLPKVKGIVLRDPDFYKSRRSNMFYEYIQVGMTNHSGKFYTPKGYSMNSMDYHFFVVKRPIVVVNEGLKGNMREYLKEKYGANVMFVRPNPKKRLLKGGPSDYDSYYNIIDLSYKKKEEWRKYIDEWNMIRDQLFKDLVDETGAETTKEYLAWLDKKKVAQRAKKGTTAYKGLNKQVGDVSIAYINVHSRGVGWHKRAIPLNKLVSNLFLTVLIDDEDTKSKDVAKMYFRMMGNDKIQFATIGKKERKKIPEHFQFINFQQFMTRDCKPFMRLASAIMFEKALEEFKKISRFRQGVFQRCLAGLLKDSEVLEKYVKDNIKFTGDEEVKTHIVTVAEEHKLFDMKLWDVYSRVKEGTKKYDFIVCLQEPRSWDKSEEERYNRTINQMLLFRKKYYDDLQDAEIVFNKEKK